LEHGLHVSESLFKAYYICPIFRYERPQKGRLREHHQFGIEALGAMDPALDVEVNRRGDVAVRSPGITGAEIQSTAWDAPYAGLVSRSLAYSLPASATMCEELQSGAMM